MNPILETQASEIERHFGGRVPPRAARPGFLKTIVLTAKGEFDEADLFEVFDGRPWEEIEEEKILRSYGELVYLDGTAFSYYLPALLRTACRASADCMFHISFAGLLNAGARGVEAVVSATAGLSDDDRRVVARSLRVLSLAFDDDIDQGYGDCLSSYWVEYLS